MRWASHSREGEDAVEHAYPRPYLSDVGHLCDAGHDERVERPGEEAIERSKEHDRGDVLRKWPENEDGKSGAEGGGHENVESTKLVR